MMNFKHALMITTLSVGLALAGGSAFAADMPMARGMVSAPPPPAMDGMYVSIFAGAAFPMTVNGSYHATPATTSDPWGIPLNTGYIIGGAIGTHLMPNLRGEIELSYTSRSVTGVLNTSTGTSSDNGSFNALYVLGNLWYDFDTGGGFTPYVGGGLGLAVLMPNVTDIGSTGYNYTTSSVAPAAQLGAGIKINVSDNIALDVGYRAKFVFNGTLTGSGGQGNATSVNYIDQSIQAGLTFGF